MKTINMNKIKDFLENKYQEIEIAYIFGSCKDGTIKKGSDIDIALYLKKGYDILLEFTIAAELERLLDEKIDITILNTANYLLAFEILRNGVRLFERNHPKRAFVELAIFKTYLDNIYYLRMRNG